MDVKESKLLLIKYEALKLLHAVYDQYPQVSYNELFESVSSIDIDKEYGNSKKNWSYAYPCKNRERKALFLLITCYLIESNMASLDDY